MRGSTIHIPEIIRIRVPAILLPTTAAGIPMTQTGIQTGNKIKHLLPVCRRELNIIQDIYIQGLAVSSAAASVSSAGASSEAAGAGSVSFQSSPASV